MWILMPKEFGTKLNGRRESLEFRVCCTGSRLVFVSDWSRRPGSLFMMERAGAGLVSITHQAPTIPGQVLKSTTAVPKPLKRNNPDHRQ